MAACTVCQSVKVLVHALVHALCTVHIFLTQTRISVICGAFIMWVGLLGSKLIKGVLLDETLR